MTMVSFDPASGASHVDTDEELFDSFAPLCSNIDNSASSDELICDIRSTKNCILNSTLEKVMGILLTMTTIATLILTYDALFVADKSNNYF